MTDEIEVGQELVPLVLPNVIGLGVHVEVALLGHIVAAPQQRELNHGPEEKSVPDVLTQKLITPC